MKSLLRTALLVALTSTALGAERSRSVQALPACDSSAAPIEKAWKTVERPETGIAFSIPGDVHEVRDPKVWCVHGCEQWMRASFTVSVSYGMWGPESFDDQDWSAACVVRRAGLTLVQMPQRVGLNHSTLVWVVQEGPTISTTGALIALRWSASADTADANGVVSSIQRFTKSAHRPPN